MPYLFLTLSVFAGVTKGFCGKSISKYTSEFKSAAFSNLIRMLFCILIGFIFLLFDGGLSDLVPNVEFILVSILSGATTAGFVIFWLFAVRRGAYVLVDVFLTLGSLLSACLSIIFYGADFSFAQGIGFAILIIATVVMCSYSAQIKTKITLSTILLLILVGCANGVSDFAKEIFNREIGNAYSASAFNFYTFVFSALTLFLVYTFSKKTEQSTLNVTQIKKKGMPYIALMSVCLFLNSFFKTIASRELDMTVIAPLSQGAALILVAIMSAIFFGEKIKPRCVVGIILAISALLIMNLVTI